MHRPADDNSWYGLHIQQMQQVQVVAADTMYAKLKAGTCRTDVCRL